MCGIYLTNIPKSVEQAKTELESIQFRGPDYTGIEKRDDLLFGHLRLSILDLDERSHQPMSHEELTIVYNGEIYNFPDIKEELVGLGYEFRTTSDTEVLLLGYKEWGKGVLEKVNGMFALAIYNAEKRTVFCARDRIGVKPFYYSWKDGAFEICSQLRPISNGKELNEDAIDAYLDCCYIPSPMTIFKDVHKLEAGKILTIDLENQSCQIEEYWNIQPVKVQDDISYEEAKNNIHELLKDAVSIRLKSDVPFGSFLSGGIDSALVTSIASKLSKDKIRSFSIGFKDPKYDESKIAAQYAKILDTDHTQTICSPEDIMALISKLVEVYDEPFADSSALPSLLLNGVTKEHVTVALSGDGGDESFLGYRYFDAINKFSKILVVPMFLRRIGAKILGTGVLGKRFGSLKDILMYEDKWRFVVGFFTGYNTLLKKRTLSWLSKYDYVKGFSKNIMQQAADLNIKLWLAYDSNVKVDRASMAYSVEVRSPFLDYRLIEYARTLPVEYRYDGVTKKKILRDILKEYIPEDVFNQPKRGFAVPLGSWIRKELREEFHSVLSDGFLNQIPNFDINKFKSMMKNHDEGLRDYSSYIWRVYVLAKWYEEFGFYKNASK